MNPTHIDMPETKDTALPRSILEAASDLWDQAGQQHFFPIAGSSMFPLLQEGDQVLVAHGSADARRGDIIVFRQGAITIAHRMLYSRKTVAGLVFVAKGDSVPHADPPVSASAIVGRVVAVKRGNRLFSMETPGWQMLGKMIAGVAVISEKLDVNSHTLKQRFLGPQPNRVTCFLRRKVQSFFSRSLRAVRTLASRWE